MRFVIVGFILAFLASGCTGSVGAQSSPGMPLPSASAPVSVNTGISVTSSINVGTATVGGQAISSSSALPALGGLAIQRPASPLDGWMGGLSVVRDCLTCVGGTPGGVSTASFSHTKAGQYETEFEWSGLDIIDSWSNSGENVARYGQGNQYGTGPVWGMVAESASLNNGAGGAMTGLEVDSWTNSADNGWRLGIGVFAGDVGQARGTGASPANGSTVGLLVGTFNNAPSSSWLDGIRVIDNIRGAAINLAGATAPVAIRIASGQPISLEGTDKIQIRYNPVNMHIEFLNGNTVLGFIDAATPGGKLN